MFIDILAVVYHYTQVGESRESTPLLWYDPISRICSCIPWDGMVSIFASYQKLSFVCKLYPREEFQYGANLV